MIRGIIANTIMSCTLFIDTETSGLPITPGFNQYYDPELVDYYANSRLVELAYIIYDQNTSIVKKKEFILKPDGFNVSNSHIHGITEKEIQEKGKNIEDVFNEFKSDLSNVSLIVAHNINFDMNIILSECYRYKFHDMIDILTQNMKYKCTMFMGKKHMKCFKSPKLTELYKFIFSKNVEQKHRALSDANICADCYFRMKKKD